jgi:hypothetical protein
MQQDHSGNGDNIGGDKNEQNNHYNPQTFYYNKPQEKRDENQHKLIKYSKETATRLLSQSLRNQVYITLNKQVDETKVIPAIQLKRVSIKKWSHYRQEHLLLMSMIERKIFKVDY